MAAKDDETPVGSARAEESPPASEEAALGEVSSAALARPPAADPPEMFEPLVEEGLALLDGEADLARAESLLERAAAIRADDAELMYGLGVVSGRRALAALRRGAALFRDATTAEALLSKSFFCYLRAVEIDPRRPEAWNNLATLYTVRGDRAQAVEALKRSLAVCPDQPNVRDRLEELGEF